MNKILGLAVLGVGAWFLWNQLSAPATAAAPTGPAPTPTPTPTPAPAPAPAPAAPSAAQQALAVLLTSAANSNGTPPPLTASGWNWIMNNLTNPGSTAAQLPQLGSQTIDALTYVQARAAAGFGLSGVTMTRAFRSNYRQRFA